MNNCFTIGNLSAASDHAKNSRNGTAIVLSDKDPVGIILNSHNALSIIGASITGDNIWNEGPHRDNVLSIQQTKTHEFKTIPWFTLKENGGLAHTFGISKDYIKSHWNKIQFSLPPKAVQLIADHFTLPVFPHIEIEAQNCSTIECSPSFEKGAPYVRLKQLQRKGMGQVGRDINSINNTVALVADDSHNINLTPICILIPINWLPEFPECGIQRQDIGCDKFSQKKAERQLEPNTIYKVTHRDVTDSEVLAISPNATKEIKDIVNKLSHSYCILHPNSPPHVPHYETNLNRLEAGALIANFMLKALEAKTTISHTITINGREQFFAVSGNPSVVENIPKVPLHCPVGVRSVNKKSLFEYIIRNPWMIDEESREFLAPKGSQERRDITKKSERAFNALSNNALPTLFVHDAPLVITNHVILGDAFKEVSDLTATKWYEQNNNTGYASEHPSMLKYNNSK